jgi:hypothetical protein
LLFVRRRLLDLIKAGHGGLNSLKQRLHYLAADQISILNCNSTCVPMCFSMSFVFEVAGIVSEAILKWEFIFCCFFADEILVFGEIFFAVHFFEGN